MKTILITGGAGFIGYNLVRFYKKKHKVIVIDNLTSKGLKKVNFKNCKNVVFFKKDLSNFDSFKNHLDNFQIDKVIHAAAHFANENSIINPSKDLKSNILGTLNLLEYFKHKKKSKIIYLSSSCIYGDSRLASENKLYDANETPYAISKYCAEKYIKFYREYYKLNISIIRVFNTYGPWEQSHKFRNVIPRFIENALKGKDLIITGSGNETRDFTYVKDLVALTSKILNNRKYINLTINSCTGKEIKIKNLAEKIIRLSNSISQIKFISKRKWDKINFRKGSIKELKKIINIENFTKIEKGLLKTINWYKSNI